MNRTLDSLLTGLAASYSKPEPIASQVLVKVVRQPKEPKAPKATKEQNEAPKAFVAPSNLPQIGSMTAKEFIVKLRDPNLSHQDKMIALAGYCGYDGKLSMGEQINTATCKAKRELNAQPINLNEPTEKELRQAKRTVQGYVAGMPDATKVKLNDLLAREVLATNNHIECLRMAGNKELSSEDRKKHAGMAAIERQRIAEIQAEIAGITG